MNLPFASNISIVDILCYNMDEYVLSENVTISVDCKDLENCNRTIVMTTHRAITTDILCYNMDENVLSENVIISVDCKDLDNCNRTIVMTTHRAITTCEVKGILSRVIPKSELMEQYTSVASNMKVRHHCSAP